MSLAYWNDDDQADYDAYKNGPRPFRKRWIRNTYVVENCPVCHGAEIELIANRDQTKHVGAVCYGCDHVAPVVDE